MKKMFGIVVVLLIMYIAIQIGYSYVVGHRNISYSITAYGDKYQVNEIFTTRHKSKDSNVVDKTNYYYEISNDQKLLFSFKIIGNYTGMGRFLKDLKIYKNGDLTCAYPVFKDKVSDLDAICNNNDKYYLYGALKGQDKGLEVFIAYLKELGYNHSSWNDTNLETKTVDNFLIYPKNIAENENFIVWQPSGFYRITSRGEGFVSLSTSNSYEPLSSALVNQYYVVPDYKDSKTFNRLFVTNLITGTMTTFDLGATIPSNSFVQGVVDNLIYLIDRGNKVQYAIDIYNKEIKITGNSSTSTKYYNNGKWEEKQITDLIDNNLVFINQSEIPKNLLSYNATSIDEIGGETDGYYYLYINEESSTSVYRVDKQNTSILTLLFKLPNATNIKYAADDICLTSNDMLYAYRNDLGLRPIVKYSEFILNKGNLYNVYVKE